MRQACITDMAEMSDYLQAVVEENRLPIGRAFVPTPHQLLVREMILQLKRGFLEIPYFEQKYGVNILHQWQSVWSEYVEDVLPIFNQTESN